LIFNRKNTLKDIKIGEKIWRARKSWGLSQMELAERVGISFQQIQKYEKGATNISVIRLYQISEALGMDISHFFENEEKASNLADASIKYVARGDDPHNLLPLNKEEITLLKLFRKIKNKKLRKCVFNQLKGIIDIENK
jgi:transcriptional regulator with XRE-family HTH domain